MNLTLLATVPIPRDLPLPQPLPEGLLQTLLVLFFLIHIFFVNLTVGGSLVVSWFEWLGRRQPRYDTLALEFAKTVTVNKSLAVVLGIGPLLCINLIYTVQWFGANALTGHAWLLIVPLVTLAFLLAYLHKYTWHRWERGGWKTFHLCIGLATCILFLAIPFIFLANVNLMLFPSEWEKVKGFFSSLKIGNVFPRYFHFILASIALAGLFGAGWFWRSIVAAKVPGFTREELRRAFYRLTFVATLLQFVAGPVLLFTLPSVGVTPLLYKLILPGVSLGIALAMILQGKIRGSDAGLARGYTWLCCLFTVIVLFMGSGRHAYREAALATHKKEVHERTVAYEQALAQFRKDNPDVVVAGSQPQTGQELFMTCAACHAPEQTLVGPSLKEIGKIYAGNPNGIVTWAKAPGKKRPEMPQMPPFGHLGDANLRKIADYMLDSAK